MAVFPGQKHRGSVKRGQSAKPGGQSKTVEKSIREENNPVYDTNHPEEPTSLGKNDQNVLYTESTTAEPTRMSTCGQNSPSSQGQDRLAATYYVAGNEIEHASTNEHYYMAPSSQGQDRLEATYVAGNEVEHTTTNEHYYMADDNNIPTPEVADVYSVSDPIHAENSAMYTASGENADDGDAIGNSEEETRVKQADSTGTMNFNSNRKANKSQPDTTVHAHKLCNPQINPADLHQNPMYSSNPKLHGKMAMQEDITVNDECDMEPYAVTDMSDHETYSSRTTNVRQQAPKADSIVTDDGDMEPYAVTNMCDNETYFSGTTSVHQQASDDSSQDTTKNPHKPHNTPNAKGLRQNPMYIPNNQQANKLCENWRCFLVAFAVFLLLVGGITTGVIMGVYHNTPGIQKSIQKVKNLSTTLNATELIHVPTIWTTDGTNPSNIGGVNGTNPSNLGTTDGTTPPNLGTTDGTTPPNLGTTEGTTPPNLGTTTEGTTLPNLGTTTEGTTPPNLGTTDGTTPPNLGTTEGTTPPNLGTTTEGTTPPNLGTTTEGTTPPSYKTFCEKERMQLSCAEDELIVIDDTFLGRRENGPRCGCTLKSCDTCPDVDSKEKVDILSYVRKKCQGLQQSVEEEIVEELVLYMKHQVGGHCPGIKKYLEVTYHCEAEVKKNITFRKDPGGRLYTSDNWGWGAVAVSSTNEILFVAHDLKKGIQVFSMEGVFVRRFSTDNKKTNAITRGRNDTLWVALKRDSGYDIQQYSKEGRELAKFTCPTWKFYIYGIAWDELSDGIILTIRRSRQLEIVRLRTDSPPRCNTTWLSAAGSIESYRQSVTVDTKGNIYVIDRRPRSNILKYGINGDRLSSFGGYGSGPGNLYEPSGICVDSLGRVFVADPYTSQVEMFTAEGEYIRTVAYVKKPRHLATGGEGQLVIDHQNFVTILPEY
ncbi:hypothetical protein Bbelb_245150 [Branchiostoma belcheri]|nr:hypothetical protein Bbelb_245150 [Branchiostoma belcheri]